MAHGLTRGHCIAVLQRSCPICSFPGPGSKDILVAAPVRCGKYLKVAVHLLVARCENWT